MLACEKSTKHKWFVDCPGQDETKQERTGQELAQGTTRVTEQETAQLEDRAEANTLDKTTDRTKGTMKN